MSNVVNIAFLGGRAAAFPPNPPLEILEGLYREHGAVANVQPLQRHRHHPPPVVVFGVAVGVVVGGVISIIGGSIVDHA